MRAHLADEKVSSIFVDGLEHGPAFGHRRNLIGAMRLKFGGRRRRDARRRFHQHGRPLPPRTKPGDLTIERCGQASFFLCADERKNRASRHGHAGVAGQLKHA